MAAASFGPSPFPHVSLSRPNPTPTRASRSAFPGSVRCPGAKVARNSRPKFDVSRFSCRPSKQRFSAWPLPQPVLPWPLPWLRRAVHPSLPPLWGPLLTPAAQVSCHSLAPAGTLLPTSSAHQLSSWLLFTSPRPLLDRPLRHPLSQPAMCPPSPSAPLSDPVARPLAPFTLAALTGPQVAYLFHMTVALVGFCSTHCTSSRCHRRRPQRPQQPSCLRPDCSEPAPPGCHVVASCTAQAHVVCSTIPCPCRETTAPSPLLLSFNLFVWGSCFRLWGRHDPVHDAVLGLHIIYVQETQSLQISTLSPQTNPGGTHGRGAGFLSFTLRLLRVPFQGLPMNSPSVGVWLLVPSVCFLFTLHTQASPSVHVWNSGVRLRPLCIVSRSPSLVALCSWQEPATSGSPNLDGRALATHPC